MIALVWRNSGRRAHAPAAVKCEAGDVPSEKDLAAWPTQVEAILRVLLHVRKAWGSFLKAQCEAVREQTQANQKLAEPGIDVIIGLIVKRLDEIEYYERAA